MTSPEQNLLHQLLHSGQSHGRNSFLVLTPTEFVMKNGWWYTPTAIPADIPLGEQNECFTNAFVTAMKYPELSYVEGYAIASAAGTRTSHAWLTDHQGNAIDITWQEPGVAYAGVPIRLDFLGRRLRDHGEIGSAIDDYLHEWPLLRDAGLKPEEWFHEQAKGREKIVGDPS